MRMWMVDPKIMCRKHLLGEHVELHMFVGSINKGKNIRTFIETNLCEPGSIRSRHEVLVEEMKSRGYNHKSELPEFVFEDSTLIDQESALHDLISRCPSCNFKYLQTLKNTKKKNYDTMRMKRIKENLNKPLSYEVRKYKSYDDTEDFVRY